LRERSQQAERADPALAAPAILPALDGMRGFLTILVLVHHVVASMFFILPAAAMAPWRPYLWINDGTEICLPIYFAISGLVLSLPAARHGTLGGLGWYAMRRVARIFPAYYLSLLVLLLIWPFFFPEVPSPMATQHGVGLVVGHLFFLQTVLFSATDIGFGLNGSVWTLTLEEGFYVALPLVAVAFRRRPFVGLGIALVFTLTWRLGTLHLPELLEALGRAPPSESLPAHLFHQFPGYAFQFTCGMATAVLYVRLYGQLKSPRWQRTAVVLHGACAVLITAMILHAGIDRVHVHGIVKNLQRDMTPAVLFGIMVLAVVLGPAWAQRVYANKVSRFLGDISYGVYVWHMILIQIVVRLASLATRTPFEAFVWLMGVVVPGSLLLGWLSFRFVERPISEYVRLVRNDRRAERI
jgi:peptidoglycan/LPS O-acetylase OafA/YrhL